MKNVAPQTSVRVGIVSSDPLRVMGLQTILAEETGYEVVPLTVPSALNTAGLEIVLLDFGSTAYLLELVAEFQRERPKIRLLILGPGSDSDVIERVIDAGARGYLSHRAKEEELKQAIHAVREGMLWAPRRVLARLVDRPRSTGAGETQSAPVFTKREREVLRLLVLGYPNRDIARQMGVDEGTIKAHVGRLMRKMGVINRTALTMRALERGLS
jgi:DNA-binding NarL/FixJ family response regulator